MGNQLRKLLYNKQFVDSSTGIARWKLSQWKVISVFLLLSISAILVYAYFFTKDPKEFLGTVLFYAIVLILAILVLWLIGNKAWSLKKRIGYFILAYVILIVIYFAMSALFGYFGLKFYIGGYILFILIGVLAGIASSKYIVDEEINRKDVILGAIVFFVFLGCNLHLNNTGSFLANVDALISKILGLIPWKL